MTTLKVPVEVALDIVDDLKDAVERGDAGSLRDFVAEARASGLGAVVARAEAVLEQMESASQKAGNRGALARSLRARAVAGRVPPMAALEIADTLESRVAPRRLPTGVRV